LETHDDFSLGSSVGRVLKKADHHAIRATWDVMHPYRAGESVADTVRHLSEKIAHVHFHDNQGGKAVLPGDGDLPIAQQIAALRSERFTGFLSAELWPDIGPPDFILQEYHQRMVGLLTA
jgi:sugar phosphate isomerase/epimerase